MNNLCFILFMWTILELSTFLFFNCYFYCVNRWIPYYFTTNLHIFSVWSRQEHYRHFTQLTTACSQPFQPNGFQLSHSPQITAAFLTAHSSFSHSHSSTKHSLNLIARNKSQICLQQASIKTPFCIPWAWLNASSKIRPIELFTYWIKRYLSEAQNT